MRLALIMAVCEGEYACGIDAIESMRRSCAGAEIDLYLIDDASPSRVGEALAAEFQRRGLWAVCQTLDSTIGFRGCAMRSFTLLASVARSGRPYDLVVKMDPDTLVIRDGLLEIMKKHCLGGEGIWGPRQKMRLKDRIPLLLDLLPAGFRRRRRGTIIEHAYELRRFRPVWWNRMGWNALRRGFKFQFVPGAMMIISMRTVQKALEREYLENRFNRGHGFITSEEDIMVSLLITACGAPVNDLRIMVPDYGDVSVSDTADPNQLLSRGLYFVHPVKPTGRGERLRAALLARSGLTRIIHTTPCAPGPRVV
jgi:hypothetical protein